MSPPRVGTRVRVDIDLPTAGPTKVVGDVVTSDQSSMGFSMRFVDLPDATREALNNAVGSLFTTSNPSEEIL